MPLKPFTVSSATALAVAFVLACSETPGEGTSATAASTSTPVSTTSGASTTGSSTATTSSSSSTSSSGNAGSSAATIGSGGMTSATNAETSGGGMAGDSGSGLFVPEDVPLEKHAGSGAGLELIAATLREGPAGLELYVAGRNDGVMSACDAAMTVEFFDQSVLSLAAWIGGLYTGQLYRASDGSDTTVACLDPVEVAMGGSTTLPVNVTLDALSY